jgi:hypothetical protein
MLALEARRGGSLISEPLFSHFKAGQIAGMFYGSLNVHLLHSGVDPSRFRVHRNPCPVYLNSGTGGHCSGSLKHCRTPSLCISSELNTFDTDKMVY